MLDEAARPFDATQVLAELAEGDFLCLDRAGRISSAYPFSATATPHTIQITGGASAYAMCAIDALGIAGMLHTSVPIRSTDPSNGEPVTVALDGSGAVWNPATAVVFVGRTADQCAGPSAAICCDHVNFFITHSTARGLGHRAPRNHRRNPEPGPRPGSRGTDIRAAPPLIRARTCQSQRAWRDCEQSRLSG